MSKLRPIAAAAALIFACASAQAGPNGPNPGAGGPSPAVGGGSSLGAAQLYAVINADGSTLRGAGVNDATTQRLSTGTYEVIFKRSITTCSWSGTIGLGGFSGSVPASHISVTGRVGTTNGVFVQTFSSADTVADLPFHILVLCG